MRLSGSRTVGSPTAMRRTTVLLTTTLWLVGCIAEPAPLDSTQASIVGGEETSDWPAVVAYITAGGTGLCTGSVIAPKTVLTAAHCGVMAAEGDVVFAGSSIFAAGIDVAVSEVHIHPDYDDLDPAHDLAVLQLMGTLDVTPVELNVEVVDDTWRGMTLHIVGYGNDDLYDGETAGIKREADVELADVQGHLIYHESPETNTCSGDSGGPILAQLDGDWLQIGVASFVYPFDLDEDYCSGGGGDVRVDSHLEWLAGFVDVDVPGDDDTDEGGDPSETSYLEEDDSGGCAASTGPTRGPAALVLLLAALLFYRRQPPCLTTHGVARSRRRRRGALAVAAAVLRVQQGRRQCASVVKAAERPTAARSSRGW